MFDVPNHYESAIAWLKDTKHYYGDGGYEFGQLAGGQGTDYERANTISKFLTKYGKGYGGLSDEEWHAIGLDPSVIAKMANIQQGDTLTDDEVQALLKLESESGFFKTIADIHGQSIEFPTVVPEKKEEKGQEIEVVHPPETIIPEVEEPKYDKPEMVYAFDYDKYNDSWSMPFWSKLNKADIFTTKEEGRFDRADDYTALNLSSFYRGFTITTRGDIYSAASQNTRDAMNEFIATNTGYGWNGDTEEAALFELEDDPGYFGEKFKYYLFYKN
jgi:hypothetical protein